MALMKSQSQLCNRDDQSITSEKLVKQLKQCGAQKDLVQGKVLHAQAIQSGLDKNMYVLSTLVLMYGQCGDMEEAHDIFNKMKYRDAVSWNILILGYVKNGQNRMALEVFDKLDCVPNAITLVAALKACAQLGCLEKGMALHEACKQLGLDKNVFVASTLVNMYSKCGDIAQAHNVFNTIASPNAVSWTSLMLGYMERGESMVVLELFNNMGCAPDRVTLVTALRACARLGKEICQQKGSVINEQAQELGLDKDVYVGTALVDMYCKSGNMSDARRVFDGMKNRDVVTWNVLILGYLEGSQSLQALEVFRNMDCPPNSVTILAALKVYARLAANHEVDKDVCLEEGVCIHRLAKKLGFDKDIHVANTLVDMYNKCGDMASARDVLNRMPNRNIVSWTSLILGYLENGEPLVALEVYSQLDCAPNSVILAAAIKACTVLVALNDWERKSCLKTGRALQKQAIELGLDVDVFVATALLDMYSKLGDMARAQTVFDGMIDKTVVSWTALVLGYVGKGEFAMALQMFKRMDCVPDCIIFVAALKACAGLATCNKEDSLREGESIFEQAKEFGFDRDVLVGSTMISLYSKCNNMKHARYIFDGMVSPDVVSLSALMFGYVENCMSSLALEVFNSINCTPNRSVFVAALKACASLGAAKMGQQVHEQVCRFGFERDEMVVTSLVDFYGKCSKMVAAELVFNGSDSLGSTVLWNGLIGGYSSVGATSQLFGLLNTMQEYGVQPDCITLQLILMACSHAGLVNEGVNQFESMSKYYRVEVTMEHYGCLVDMLGRTNRLEEALKLVRRMPFQPNSIIWSTLLSSCQRWNNVQIARLAFTELVALDEDKEAIASAHVLLRNMYERIGASDMLSLVTADQLQVPDVTIST